MWFCIKSKDGFEIGFYDPQGNWIAVFKEDYQGRAIETVCSLNGGGKFSASLF